MWQNIFVDSIDVTNLNWKQETKQETWRKLKQLPLESAGLWLMDHIPIGIATYAVISCRKEHINHQYAHIYCSINTFNLLSISCIQM